MTRAKKTTNGEMTVKVDDRIGDGEGGYLKKGAKFTPVNAEAAESLKAKGLAE